VNIKFSDEVAFIEFKDDDTIFQLAFQSLFMKVLHECFSHFALVTHEKKTFPETGHLAQFPDSHFKKKFSVKQKFRIKAGPAFHHRTECSLLYTGEFFHL
jgi:hypothetical protein